MKKAFTMIELIFVIVILGILAAVAVPKLTATRDDATVSSIGMAIGQSISELAEYAVSNGKSIDDLTLMSNSLDSMVRQGSAYKVSGKEVIVKIKKEDCINIKISENGGNDDLNVSFINSTKPVCLSLQKVVSSKTYSISLRGLTIVY